MSIILSSIPNKPARQSPLYTVLSLLLLAAIFYQPYTTRLAIWQRVLDIAAHFTQDKQQQKLYIVLFGGMIIHTTVFVVLNMVMTVIYYIDWPYFEQFKISHKQWPWRDTDPIVRQQYWSLVKKSFVNLFINSYVVSPILFMAGWQRAEPLTSVELSEVPHWYTTAWQVLVFMLIEDTLFYFAHRALHHPAIYRHIHKRHHEFKQPIGIASEYAHAVEFVFSNAIPFTAGPQLLHAHCYTFFIWYIWRIGETIDGHSGYEVGRFHINFTVAHCLTICTNMLIIVTMRSFPGCRTVCCHSLVRLHSTTITTHAMSATTAHSSRTGIDSSAQIAPILHTFTRLNLQ